MIKYNLLIVIFLIAFPFGGSAQFTETRQVEKRYLVLPSTQIEITNKYGLIELNTWDKDSIWIKVDIKVEEKKLAKLQKTLDEIKIDMNNSSHYLVVRTLVGENLSQIESELLKFKEALLQSDGSVTINMTVWLPDKHELKLENKFGDIIMGDYAGNVTVVLSNGKLKARTLSEKMNLNLSFGGATVNKVNNAKISANYSDLLIKEAEQLQIDSKSSSIEIFELNSLVANSRRDKYRVRSIGTVEAYGNFSSFRISKVEKQARFRTSYGDITLEEVVNGFDNLYIESKSTDIDLLFDIKSRFNFEITESRTTLNLGKEAKITSTVMLDYKEKKNKHEGSFGEKSSGAEKLIINAVTGTIGIHSN